mgnify:CR=1 FL=1
MSFKEHFEKYSSSYVTMIVVVVVGYLVTFMGAFSDEGYTATVEETVIAVVLGVVYLIASLVEDQYFERFSSVVGKAFYFAFVLSVLFIINWLIGPGGIWLVSLPVAATAVIFLPFWGQIIVDVLLLAVMVLPLGIRYGAWEGALFLALSLSPAILFVVVFTKAQQNAQEAREQAEALTAELEQANRQLTEYATQAEELATIEERNRVAREIHDNLGHYLTVVNVQIGAAKVLITQEQLQKATEALDKAQTLTQEGLTAVRQSVATLRESPIGNKPLAEAIAPFINETNNAGILTTLTVNGDPHVLDPKVAFTLYRVVQEGLTNVRRHAHASSAEVILDYTLPHEIRLKIKDDGVGTAVVENGFGLIGVQERVQLLNGNVNIESKPGESFALQITIPINGISVLRDERDQI